MDWLKDKKNQPIVALIAALVIVAVVVIMYFTMFKPDSTDTGTDTSATTDPSMGTSAPTDPAAAGQPGTPTAPAAAGAQPAAGTATQVTSAAPTETYRSDPFLPIGYKPPKRDNVPRPKPPIWDLPIPPAISVYPTIGGRDVRPVYESPQPARRMAGLMLNGKVYAIIESNGASEVVQPGDMLKDGLATVEKIERDKITLKTTDEKPRYLVVSMAANRQDSYSGGDSGGGMPGGGMPGGGMPGGGMPRPMPRGGPTP